MSEGVRSNTEATPDPVKSTKQSRGSVHELGENAAFDVNEAPAIDTSLIQQDPTSEPSGENLG